MSKRIKDTDYLAISARIRSMENGLLTREKMEQLLEAHTDEETARLLREWGYGNLDPRHPGEMDAALSALRETVLADLVSGAPEPGYADVFRLQYDYHNVKVLLKAAAVGTDPSSLLIDAGCVKVETLTEMVRRGETTDLPECLAEAITEGRAILATTRDPQLSDITVDRWYWLDMRHAAEVTGSDFLMGYVKIRIDAANLRTLIRALRMKKNEDFLRSVLFDGGEVDVEAVLKAARGGTAALEELYANTRFCAAAKRGAEALDGGRLTEFEKLCDDAVADYLSGARFVPFGEAPLLAYLAARETEYTNLRILLLGRSAGLDADVIRSRLRTGCV